MDACYGDGNVVGAMNATGLFNALRTLTPHLSQEQVDSVNAILVSCTKHGITDVHSIAYIIATAYHEARLKPVEEIGKGQNRTYGSKFKQNIDKNGRHIPYTTPDKIYYGRSFCQLTWYENYATFGRLLGIDLLNHPELALQTDIAAEIIVIGMKGGLFTGKSLDNYFTGVTNDPVNSRKIINGLDCAQLIAGYYGHILDGITV